MENTATCPSCRRGIFAEDAFCSWCGTRVDRRARGRGEERRALAMHTIPTADRVACGSCNGPILPGDVFCPACGARCAAAGGASSETVTAIANRVCGASDGKYAFVRELGRGGMGIVFVARDTELERLVAIKVLSPAWLADEAMVERFRREARTIASLRHESIVTVYEDGRADDLCFFVMDYIEGVSLSQILRAHGPLPIPQVEAILYSVGNAMSYAHRPGRGIVHRDIKPSNIMLDTEGAAVVMDFGISKVSEQSSGLTNTGLVIGTPEYMSPEQCRGHTVTQASDQYSLGAVTYALLTGAPPFTGPFYQVLMAHQTEPVPSLLTTRPDCPPRLASAIEKMLAKHPSDRWPTIKDAINSLGLRPLADDDPVRQELGALVRRTDPQSVRGAPTRPTPTSIRLLPQTRELEIGDEVDLTATLIYDDGIEELGDEITWESTNPGIVRVDPATGRIAAVGSGTAVITATSRGLQESLALEIRPPQVVAITIEPETVEIEVGSTVLLHAQARDKRGKPVPRASIAWASSDPLMASVSSDGVVTARQSGAVAVLAHGEGVGATTVVRIRAKPVTVEAPRPTAAHVRLSSPPDEVRVSDTFRIIATPLDEAGSSVVRPVTWSIEPPGVLEDLGEGRFRARMRGEGAVIAEADGARTRVRVAVLDARPIPPPPARTPAAEKPPPPPPPPPPKAVAPKAESARPAVSARVLWIALALAIGAGGVWALRGMFAGGPPEPEPVADIAILTADGGRVDPAGVQADVGDTLRFSAATLSAAGSDLGRSVSWASEDPSVADFASAGLLVARAGGATRIRVTADTTTRTLAITVTAAVVTPVAAQIVVRRSDGRPAPERLELAIGASERLAATVVDASQNPVAGEPRWNSSAPGIAAVDQQGRITARSAGNARITATFENLTRNVDIVVPSPPGPPEGPSGPGSEDATVNIFVRPFASLVEIDGVRQSVRQGDGQSELQVRLRPGRRAVRIWIGRTTQFDTTIVVEAGRTYTIRKEGGES